MGQGRKGRTIALTRAVAVTVQVALAAGIAAGAARAQDPAPATEASRMERLEQMVSAVVEENRRLAEEVRSLKEQLTARPSEPPPASPPVPTSSPPPGSPSVTVSPPVPTSSPPPSPSIADATASLMGTPAVSDGSRSKAERFRVDYENGFSILPEDLDKTPFSLRVRSQNIFRYNGFTRDAPFWTDSAGNRVAIDNSNFFGVPRGRLIFSGTALLPRLSYLLNIDYNSVTNNPIGFRAYELGYRFSRAFEIYVGQSKVPGSREWLESASAPLQGSDRSMATTFFRPSLSQGIWVMGQPLDGLYYQAMMSNGFNTLNLQPSRLNNRFCYSGSVWWEPWGDFGRGYSDIQFHESAAFRLGGCYTMALGRGIQSDSDAVENSPVRLSDGTIITTPGALAPGVTLQTYDLSLAAIDLSYKYRGLGLSTELYFQELLRLQGNGSLPLRSTGAFGGFVQGGYFILPQQAELFARASYVTGRFGSGSELACGFNWFFLKGKDNLRFTFDSAWLDSSPAGQNRTGFVAGQTGLLIRTQITVHY